MIEEHEFKNLILAQKKFDKRVDEVSDVLQSDIFQSDVFSHGGIMFSTVLKYTFNESTRDIIESYLWDNLREVTIDDVNYPLENLDQLWHIVQDGRI